MTEINVPAVVHHPHELKGPTPRRMARFVDQFGQVELCGDSDLGVDLLLAVLAVGKAFEL